MADTPPKTRLWIRITLFLSLALNVLVIGAIVGVALRGGEQRFRAPPQFLSAGGPLLNAIPNDERRALLRDLRDRVRDGQGGVLRGRREAVGRLADVIAAEPFDRAALEAELQVQIDLGNSILTEAQAALVDWVEGLSPEEREAYAERVRKANQRGSQNQGNR